MKQDCAMLDGDDFEECMREIKMKYEIAVDECIPRTCKEQYEVDYNRVMEFCLGEGGNQFICDA